MDPGSPPPSGDSLSPDDRKWLHDKFERLTEDEGQLAAGRTSYFAAVVTVLITAVVVSVADLSAHPLELALVVTFLCTLGILITSVWWVLLHRTNDAHALWTQASLQLERSAPPVPGTLPGSIRLRTGEMLSVNLLHPAETHAERFSRRLAVTWFDRVSPEGLTELLPQTFLIVWGATVVLIWSWFFLVR